MPTTLTDELELTIVPAPADRTGISAQVPPGGFTFLDTGTSNNCTATPIFSIEIPPSFDSGVIIVSFPPDDL